MPYSVVTGFMSGIWVILIIPQLSPLLVHPSPGGGVIGTLSALIRFARQFKIQRAVFGLLTLEFCFFTTKIPQASSCAFGRLGRRDPVFGEFL